jgi:drug/metabolite transporter (DMT)-like permease
VLVLSRLLFGHRIGPRRLLAVAVGFAGVLVMLRPDPRRSRSSR